MRSVILILGLAVLLFCAARLIGRPEDAAQVGGVQGTVYRGAAPSKGWMIGVVTPGTQHVIQAEYVNSDGTYALGGIPVGSYELHLYRARRGPSGDESLERVSPIVISASSTLTHEFSFTRANTRRRLSGRIHPALPDVVVAAYRNGASIALTLTDVDGAFELDLDFGSAQVVVVAWPEDYANSRHTLAAGKVAVELGRIDLTTVGGAISGTVTHPPDGASTEPVEPMDFFAMRDVGGTPICFGMGRTDAAGAYAVLNLPPGTYTVRGGLPGTGPEATGIRVTAGQTTVQDFTLVPR